MSDNGWTAGENGDCIGVNIVSYSDSSITFTLGSGYTLAGYYGPLTDGDSFSMTVERDHLQRHRLVPVPDVHPVALVTDPGPNTVTPIDTTTGAAGNLFPFNTSEPVTSPSPPTAPPPT